ncbi:MAG: hypothetical protein L0H93_16660, partial [Nocardioides sp.]|nr:hypothetical protein [Nocardioides sp.]
MQPEASPSTRYPLFADELPTRSPDVSAQHTPGSEQGQDIAMWVPPAPTTSAPPSTAASVAADPGTHRDRAHSGKAGWVVAVVLLLVLCTVGVAWLVNRDGSEDVAGRDAANSSRTEDDPGSDASRAPEDGNDEDSDPKTPKPADDPPV